MAISFQRTSASMLPLPGLLYSVPLTPQQATVDPCLCWSLLDTHRQVWLFLLWGHCSFLLGPGGHTVMFVPTKSLCFPSPVQVLYQVLLTVKVRFPGDSQSLCWIPRLGSLLWDLELLQQCENSFGILVLQFVCRLPGGSIFIGTNGDVLQEDLGHTSRLPGLLLSEPLSPWQATADPCLRRRL